MTFTQSVINTYLDIAAFAGSVGTMCRDHKKKTLVGLGVILATGVIGGITIDRLVVRETNTIEVEGNEFYMRDEFSVNEGQLVIDEASDKIIYVARDGNKYPITEMVIQLSHGKPEDTYFCYGGNNDPKAKYWCPGPKK